MFFHSPMKWYDTLEKELRDHIQYHITESSKYKKEIRQAKNAGNAQLWLVIGNLSKQILLLHEKVDTLEKKLTPKKTTKRKVQKKTKSSRKKKDNLTKSLEKF